MSVFISVDETAKENRWWKELVSAYARVGDKFEIHCWADEIEAWKLVEKFGWKSRESRPDVVVINGIITSDLVAFLTSGKKPKNGQGYNKMTPCYIVRLGKDFSSEQYGTEVLLTDIPKEKKTTVESALQSISRFAKVYRNI